ncbi:MAG: hypothetical protein EOO20_10525 [Chryseobacterium sp.]|nr:MAG: hypothetical protein EOO20_10525 [Chryseobacterium sp.]
MHRISHTALPPERMSNTVKEGGLWHRDEGEKLVREARQIVQPRKVKDQFVTFARWFWAVVALGTVITFFILNRR